MAVARKISFTDRLLSDPKGMKEFFSDMQNYKEKVSELNSDVLYSSDEKNEIETLEGDLLSRAFEYADGTELSKDFCDKDNKFIYSSNISRALHEYYTIDSKYQDKLEDSMFNVEDEQCSQRTAIYFNELSHEILTQIANNSAYFGVYNKDEKKMEKEIISKYKKIASIKQEKELEISYSDVNKLLKSKNFNLEENEDKNISNIIELMKASGINKRDISRETIDTFNKNIYLYNISSSFFDVKTNATINLMHSIGAKQKEGLKPSVNMVFYEDKEQKIDSNSTAKFLAGAKNDLLPSGWHIRLNTVYQAIEKFNVNIDKIKGNVNVKTANVPLKLANKTDKRYKDTYCTFLNEFDAELKNDGLIIDPYYGLETLQKEEKKAFKDVIGDVKSIVATTANAFKKLDKYNREVEDESRSI